jgi:hypothetical protein
VRDVRRASPKRIGEHPSVVGAIERLKTVLSFIASQACSLRGTHLLINMAGEADRVTDLRVLMADRAAAFLAEKPHKIAPATHFNLPVWEKFCADSR